MQLGSASSSDQQGLESDPLGFSSSCPLSSYAAVEPVTLGRGNGTATVSFGGSIFQPQFFICIMGTLALWYLIFSSPPPPSFCGLCSEDKQDKV